MGVKRLKSWGRALYKDQHIYNNQTISNWLCCTTQKLNSWENASYSYECEKNDFGLDTWQELVNLPLNFPVNQKQCQFFLGCFHCRWMKQSQGEVVPLHPRIKKKHSWKKKQKKCKCQVTWNNLIKITRLSHKVMPRNVGSTFAHI